MGTTVSAMSSPEPEARSLAERAMQTLGQKPLRMAHMLRLSRLVNDCSAEEKRALGDEGVAARVCHMIGEFGSMMPREAADGAGATPSKGKWRRSSSAPNVKGVGYGTGSTRSRWDIERAVEERLVREEHLTWLLNTLTAYLYCASPDFSDPQAALDAQRSTAHVTEEFVRLVDQSAIMPLLEYHLKNESVFDVSEHMELYQALFEVACSMALYPALLDFLVHPRKDEAHSIVSDLVPKFRSVLDPYPNAFRSQMGSPDFRLVDFIQKTERWAALLEAARDRLDSSRSPSDGAGSRAASTPDEPAASSRLSSAKERSLLYVNGLKHLQVQTCKFIGDYGKLAVPFAFKKEARNLNPFSPSLKERTKRIAKELASLPNSLPLSTSNSIFICVDEGRCDIMKVLVSGPEETPYQNGLFEFDVFFPSSYPFSPPKLSFLTTGGGSVRFNPNLYNDGKICLSILGTWEGRPEEKWNPYCSLLQVLMSIQGLIFVKEPYFNEPGFEKYIGTDKGRELSRKYNMQIEHATLQYAVRDQMRNGAEHFRRVIQRHFWLKRGQVVEQARRWLTATKLEAEAAPEEPKKRGDAAADALTAYQTQERGINSLVDELLAFACPVDYT